MGTVYQAGHPMCVPVWLGMGTVYQAGWSCYGSCTRLAIPCVQSCWPCHAYQAVGHATRFAEAVSVGFSSARAHTGTQLSEAMSG
eukprot:946624-Pelagomonas_calceolata.AAC.1